MTGIVNAPSAALPVVTVGVATEKEREYAVEKVTSLTAYAPIRAAHVVISVVGDAFAPRGVMVRVNLTGDRLFVHADADGTTAFEAIDRVRQRLYQLLTRHHRHGHQGGRHRG